MPASYLINPDLGFVYTVAWRRLTMPEAEAHHTALADDSRFDPQLMHLMDFSRVEEFELSPDDAIRLSARGMWAVDARRAVAAPKDLAFGMSQLFQARARVSEDHYGVFRTVEAAWQWLGFDMAPALPPLTFADDVDVGFVRWPAGVDGD